VAKQRYLWRNTETGVIYYKRTFSPKQPWLPAMMGCDKSVWLIKLDQNDIDGSRSKEHVRFERLKAHALTRLGSDASHHDGDRELMVRFVAECRSRAGGRLAVREIEDGFEGEALFDEYAEWCLRQGLDDPRADIETVTICAGPQAGETIPVYPPEATELIRTWEIIRVMTALGMDTVEDIPAPITKPAKGGRSDSLTDLETKYLSEKPKLTRGNRHTLKEMIGLFVRVNGNLPAQQYTDDHAAAFREEMAKGKQTGNTKARKMRVLAALLSWAKKARLISSNILSGVTFDGSDKKKKMGFTTDQLQAFVSLPMLHQPTGKRFGAYGDRMYWVAMLCILHGMRRREAAQLYKNDIIQIAGMWVIRIDDHNPGQKVKNDSSRRLIPMSREIVRLGFLEYVKRANAGPLYGAKLDPVHCGDYGHLGSVMNDLVRKAGITSNRQTFHGTRIGMIDQSRECGLDTETRKTITGHALVDIGEQYGETSLTVKKRELDKLKYPVRFPRFNEPKLRIAA